MFGKLKDKLKKSLSVFSKKAEEEAVEKEIEVEVTEESTEEEKIVSAQDLIDNVEEEPITEESNIGTTFEPFFADEQTKTKEEPEEEEVIVQQISEDTEEVIIPKDFDSAKKVTKSKDSESSAKPAVAEEKEVEEKEEDSVTEEDIEKFDEEIKKENLSEEIPQKYDITKHKFEPDFEKIKEVIEEKTELKETEPIAEEPKKEKKLFGLFKKKEHKEEKIIEDKEIKKDSIEPVTEKKLEDDTKILSEPKKSFFGKVKQSLTTKTISADKFDDLFWDLELALLESNVSMEVIEKIKEDLKDELVDKPLPRDVLKKIEETLKKTLTEILTFDRVDILSKVNKKKPFIITFFGINGTGKTTSIAKLTHFFKENNLSVVLAACDTFRAAAIQQLEEHAKQLGVKIIKHDYGSDAAAVAFDAVKYAEKNKIDVVLIDTAGRLHSNTNLMQELEKIIRVTKPDLKIFVGESITGNDCIEQAKKFNELVEMDGAILTKADIDEKGGAPLSIAYTIKKPILFLGMGQEYKDLEEFDKDVILERLGF